MSSPSSGSEQRPSLRSLWGPSTPSPVISDWKSCGVDGSPVGSTSTRRLARRIAAFPAAGHAAVKDRVNAISLAPAEDFRPDSGRFGEHVGSTETQRLRHTAFERGLQSRTARSHWARCSPNFTPEVDHDHDPATRRPEDRRDWWHQGYRARGVCVGVSFVWNSSPVTPSIAAAATDRAGTSSPTLYAR
jgi:hypothetical protein